MKTLRIASVALSLLAGAGMGAISAGIIQNSILKVFIYIIFIISLVGVTGLTIYDLRKNSWKDFSTQSNATEVLTQALDLACLAMGQPTFRANIFMRCERDKNRICIKYHSTNMEGAIDLGLKLERWQGCAGQAWGYSAPIVADLTLPAVRGGSKWGLTDDQFKMTEGLSAVLSVPVRHPENDSLIAILNFDTKESIAELLTQDQHKTIALQVAKQVGLLIFGFGGIEPL